MSDDRDDNVVPFPRGQFDKARNEREAILDELPVRAERWKPGTCEHTRSTVDERARTLTCRDCGVALDPIDVLQKLAHNREYLVMHGRRLRDEAQHLQERVDGLVRQEKNLKARLRRAEHPALKEARLALQDAEKALWKVHDKIAFDPTLQRAVMSAWQRTRSAAEKLKPSKVATG